MNDFLLYEMMVAAAREGACSYRDFLTRMTAVDAIPAASAWLDLSKDKHLSMKQVRTLLDLASAVARAAEAVVKAAELLDYVSQIEYHFWLFRFNWRDDGDVESGPHLSCDVAPIVAANKSTAIKLFNLSPARKGHFDDDFDVEEVSEEVFAEYEAFARECDAMDEAWEASQRG